MNGVCGQCGHEREYHHRGRWCQVLLSSAGVKRDCTCSRFVSIATLIALRTGLILLCVAILGTFEGLFGGAPR